MTAPLILWFRRDLRLDDHPMLTAALASGRPLLPVFVLDPETEAMGAAARWRLGEALSVFAASLAALGSRLILRRGPAPAVLRALVAETGAAGVLWSRLYGPEERARDAAVKTGLRGAGLQAESFPGFLLHEPWTVETGQGGPYRVYTPYWNAVRSRDVAAPLPAPAHLPAPDLWPAGDDLSDWRLGAGVNRGAGVLAGHAGVGEGAAQARLSRFLDGPVGAYRDARDRMGVAATSGLSENLTWGEISPRRIWHGGLRARHDGAAGAEHFLKELVWREFAWHLFYHYPAMDRQNWRAGWDDFPWRGDSAEAEAWRRGRTGEPVVDAAMRELYATGRMHNRARMIVASYLTKHLLTHWRIGLDWFADCLTDWDPAANAMGWQWVAGCGPDAAPYFRIFNPATQAATHDPDGDYRRHWLAPDGRGARDYLASVPRSWAMAAGDPPPLPLIDLGRGRARALAAYGERNT